MITRAIVEYVLSPYEVKVKIPIFDGAEVKTDKKDLTTATICSLPNCCMNVQVGDIVFIGFEDNTYHKAVILGHLSRELMQSTYSDVSFGRLDCFSCANLPYDTKIGEVSSKDISCLKGLKGNVQSQLDILEAQVKLLLAAINIDSDKEE